MFWGWRVIGVMELKLQLGFDDESDRESDGLGRFLCWKVTVLGFRCWVCWCCSEGEEEEEELEEPQKLEQKLRA